MLLHNLMDDVLISHSEKKAFISDKKSLSYRDLNNFTSNITNLFLTYDKGDKIIFITNNDLDVIPFILAASKAGLIFTVLQDGISERNINYIINELNPVLILGNKESTDYNFLSERYYSFEDFMGINSPKIENKIDRQIYGNDTVGIIYTSGTSGYPKGVVVSHRNIVFTTKELLNRLNILESDVIGNFLPLSFDYGLYQIFLSIASKSTLYLGTKREVGPQLIYRIKQEKINYLPVVPSLAHALIKLEERIRTSGVNLRVITNTGETLPYSKITKLKEIFKNVDIYLMYGLTECKRVSILDPKDLFNKKGSVGKPLDNIECYIVDNYGNEQRVNEIGELVVVGDNVTSGYFKNKELSSIKFDTWRNKKKALFTGDYCSIDEDGYLYFHGRKDDMYKQKGYRISSIEIEDITNGIEGVELAALIPSTEANTITTLYVQTEHTVKYIIKELKVRLEEYKIPPRIVKINKMPITNNGKVDRKKLKNSQ